MADQYQLIWEAIADVDAINRAAAWEIWEAVSGMESGRGMTVAEADRARRIVDRALRPVYGASRARATSSDMFRSIADTSSFASEQTLRDYVLALDKSMRNVDDARWRQVVGRIVADPEADDLARVWADLGGPYATEVRRGRARFIDPNRRWVDPNGYRLSDRVWQAGVRVRNAIDTRIRIGVRRGESPLTIAKRIEKYLNPDYAPLMYTRDGRVLRKRVPGARDPHGASAARRLARTEVQHAAHEATVRFVDAVDVPGAGVKWALSNAHPKIDICDSLARASSLGYPPGVYRPQEFPNIPHPQCLCSSQPVMPSREAVLDHLFARYGV